MGLLENKLEKLFLEILCTTLLMLLGITAEVYKYTAQKSRYYTNSRLHLSLLCRAQSKLCDSFVITVFLKSVNIIFEDGDMRDVRPRSPVSLYCLLHRLGATCSKHRQFQFTTRGRRLNLSNTLIALSINLVFQLDSYT
jgi:3-methyladenine DNA glycosylase Mpg